MLSYNLFLLKSSPLHQVGKRVLALVFSMIFLDMYDLALYIGYSIYLRSVLLPNLEIYSGLLVFATILLVSQLAKVVGFIRLYSSKKIYNRSSAVSKATIIIAYCLLAIIPSYQAIGYWAIIIFAILRIIQGFFFGVGLSYTIRYAQHGFKYIKRKMMYTYIILAGECGILVSIWVNRFLVTDEARIYIDLWRTQLLVCAGIMLLNFILSHSLRKQRLELKEFGRYSFIYTIKKYWVQILLRSTIAFFHVALIITVILRAPNMFHLVFGMSIAKINKLLFFMSILTFFGANLAWLITRIIKPYHFMLLVYVSCIIFNVIWLCYGNQQELNFYIIWLYWMSFFYGIYVRLTPMVLYPIVDFRQHNRLIGRYLSYLIGYSVFGGMMVFILDTTHYLTHTVHSIAPLVLLIVASFFGLVSLMIYAKYYQNS